MVVQIYWFLESFSESMKTDELKKEKYEGIAKLMQVSSTHVHILFRRLTFLSIHSTVNRECFQGWICTQYGSSR